MAVTTPQTSPDPSIGRTEHSPDPISEFLIELDGLLRRWNGRTAGHWTEQIVYSLNEEDPAKGCARLRRGPQAKINLTVTDTSRTDDLTTARYADASPVDWPPVDLAEQFDVALEA